MFTRYFALRHLCTAATVLALTTPGVVYAQAQTYALDIPAQDLDSALKALAAATGQQVVFRGQTVKGKRSNALKGRYPVDDAFEVMISGTGLMISRSARGVVVIAQAKVAEADDDSGPDIVVTGSHIRDANPTSPVRTISRKDIDVSGYSQIGDLVRSLPENFSGGQNPGVLNANTSNFSNSNLSNASTVNFRGLGSDATLTLLNGHRLVNDSYFQAPDISGIPLAAVSRVETVTDGASAVYGSDAVAGVMNIILNKHYNGLETSAHIGGATQGGGLEQTYNILAGKSGASSYAIVSLEYSDQNAIIASQRDFTSSAYPDTSLLMAQRRRSAFVSAGLNLSSSISVSLDALYSDRSVDGTFAYSGTVNQSHVFTPTYNVALGSEINLPRNWKVSLTAVAGGSHNSTSNYYPDFAYTSTGYFQNTLRYVEAVADGTLWRAPTGDVKAALGGGYREESFQQGQHGDSGFFTGSRRVKYLFAEIQAPLIEESDTRTGLHEFTLSASGRAEDYSDFGSTANPKVGLRYRPFNDLSIRASWGKSFKAPSFFQLYQPMYLFLDDAVFRGADSDGTSLDQTGGNPNLKPERATFWTLGADYNPSFAKSLRLSLTYFNTDFRDRVVQPIDSISTTLSDPIYAPFVTLNPSASNQAALMAAAREFINYSSSSYDPADVIALIHSSQTNALTQKIRGFDLAYSQTFVSKYGSIKTFANGSWLQIRQQTLPTLPERTLSGLIGYAPKFKARGGATFDSGGFSGTGIINYIAGETDFGVTPEASIASWTTVDLNLSYHFPNSSGFIRGLRVALSASNLFDRAPPYASSPGVHYTGLNYDAANHSAVGRFVSFTLSKSW